MVGILGMMIGPNHLQGFLKAFATSILSGGYLLGLFYFEVVHKNQYFFFYNKGYSKPELIFYTYILQLPVLVIYML